MKRRLSAVLLALGLTVSAFSMGVYAEETETTATEQVTESVTEADAVAEIQEAESDPESEAAPETDAASQAVSFLTANLEQVSAWTDDQIEMMIEGKDLSSAVIALNWKSVKEELGAFVEVTDAELSADGQAITGHAKYEKINDKTTVTVTYSVNQEAQTVKIEWDIAYPMGILMERAALNTVMGLGIVFLTLLFLSALIGQLHIIPDTIEKMSKKKEAPAAAPSPAAAPVVEEEEELVDDLELVAVITAAIAASENTSGDGFVVRSIKKANKRNWQRA